MPERYLAVENASVCYGAQAARTRALADLTLAFERGTLTLVMGPSGSGKTSLLSLLGCIRSPEAGSVYVEDQEVGRLGESAKTEIRRNRIGFVFQNFRLFHALSAVDNVALADKVAGGGAGRERALELLHEFGLAGKERATPAALSGGEKQRVAMARALIKNPPILLADEPTASLDSTAGRQICEILRRLADAQKRTVVVVSHDPRWQEFAHRTVVLRDGQVNEDRRNQA